MGSNSPKFRDYFVTINEEAESYGNALERLKELNYKLFAFIVHDKDKTLKEIDGEIIEEPKRVHKHFVVELKNPITFQSMLNKFPGSHIETIKYKKSAYQYLVHNSPRSKGEKYQYAIDEIISNDITAVKFAIETEDNEVFKENAWLRYVAEGTRTAYQFTKRFGLNVFRQYWKPYSEMLANLPNDQEMQADLEAIEKAMAEELPF